MISVMQRSANRTYDRGFQIFVKTDFSLINPVFFEFALILKSIARSRIQTNQFKPIAIGIGLGLRDFSESADNLNLPFSVVNAFGKNLFNPLVVRLNNFSVFGEI